MTDLGRKIGPQHAPGPQRPIQSADRSPAAWIDGSILAESGERRKTMFFLIWNEAEQKPFRFVPDSSVGWRRSLSRVKMNVLRTPLTALVATSRAVTFRLERPPRRP
jgi:hypothetical protein